jgi:serine/threonine-protein kinase
LQKLGKYEILAELGHGAMGVVYKARDPFIGRLVALKTINSSLVDRPDLLERFYQEAQSAGKLQHPSIVTIFELGQEKDTPFIAMEYLDGESLEKTILRQTEMPLAVKIGYIVRICQALEYAHKNRVVHRDIKPGNVMVNSEGAVKVVDFGIARLVDFSRTHTNMMIGTPAYMAPELFKKQRANERTDIWAVGITCYELICYQRPFTGDGYDIISSIMEDEVPPISATVPDCPEELDAVIKRMLRKPTGERYQTMEDVLLDLEPVWNRLKASEATALADRARALYEQGDLLKAQDRLKRARQIDSTNPTVKSLLEKISAEVRRSEIAPKIQEHLSRGRGLLQSGQFREAQAEVEAALGLDSRHEAAHELLGQVEAAVARAQQLEQKLRMTKQRLAEGALEEAETALRKAMEIDAEDASALDLQRQINAERARREKRKQLNELLHRARTLWTELKYDECLALIADALKNFPNDPELKSLQETARADQAEQKKQVQVAEVRRLMAQQKLGEARKSLDALTREQPQDTTVRNLQSLLAQEEQEQKKRKRLETEMASLRSLVGEGKFKEAATRGELLVRDYPQEYELKDLVTYAKSESVQQEQKKKEEDHARQIRSFMEAERYREAVGAARQAAEEFPKHELFRGLLAEAERQNKEQQSREKAQREMQARVQEIRSKIKRAEFSDAVDLAKQTIAAYGSDTDVTQLLHAAEVEAQQRDKKKEERDRRVNAAKTLLDKGEFGAATQLLSQAMATKIISQTDMQAKLLMSEITQKEEEARRVQEQKKKEEERKRKATQTGTKPPVPGAGTPARDDRPPVASGAGEPTRMMPPGPSQPTVAQPIFAAGATELASPRARTKPSTPVMTPLPTMAGQGAVIQTQVKVQEGLAGTSEKPKSNFLKKPAVLAVVAVALVGVGYGVVRIIWPSKPPKPPMSAEDQALETEAKQLWSERKFDDSQEKWKKLADHDGPFHKEAVEQVRSISDSHVKVEQLYANGMKLLYSDKKPADAAEKFKEVVDMNLWKVDEARKEYDTAMKPNVPAKPLWQALFEEGRQSFDRKEYKAAQSVLQQVPHAEGVSRDVSRQASDMLSAIADRETQKNDFDRAASLERAGQTQQAFDAFKKVAGAPHGDRDLVATANDRIRVLDAELRKPKVDSTKNPGVDYGPTIEAARGLVSQYRWDDAAARLSGVPQSTAGYSDLMNQINTGRREDQDFLQKKAEVSQAESRKTQAVASKNKNDAQSIKSALQTLRPFFSTETGSGDRHSGDARKLTFDIDSDVKELDAVINAPVVDAGKGTPSGPTAADEIRAVVQQFAKAYDAGDKEGVLAVRQYDVKEAKKLPETLANVKGQGFVLRNCSEPIITGNTAVITCDASLTSKPNLPANKSTMQLRNFGAGRWMILTSK